MGYELKLYIGKKYPYVETTNEKGMTVTAMFDLCKPGKGEVVNLLAHESKKEDKELAYIYDSDGDTKIKVDSYGDILVHIKPEKILEAIKKDHKESPYRVYRMVIPYLRSAIKTYGKENLTCVLYGY